MQVLIHEFEKHKPVVLDDEGDQMLGFYYQFGTASLIGPFKHRDEVESAAQRAFATNDI